MSEPAIQKPRTYPRWVGVILCLLLPGSAHFLSGQKLLGIGLGLGCYVLNLGLLILPTAPSIPALWAVIATCTLLVFAILYYIALLIFSYRPVYRLGCFGWLLFFCFLVLLSFLPFREHRNYREMFSMQGISMAPTLIDSSLTEEEIIPTGWTDRIVVNKWIYRTCEPQRGDLVVFQTDKINKNKEGLPTVTVVVNRLVGLPGETVDIDPPYVLINGKRLTEPAIFDTISSKQEGYSGYFQPETLGGPASLPITLGPEEYFLLGDNSPRSYDSRYWGPVQREKIRGKAIRIYWPPSRIRDLE